MANCPACQNAIDRLAAMELEFDRERMGVHNLTTDAASALNARLELQSNNCTSIVVPHPNNNDYRRALADLLRAHREFLVTTHRMYRLRTLEKRDSNQAKRDFIDKYHP